MDISVPLVGFIVGILIGLTGMGGGALMTPVMILLFNVPPVFAVGVDFVYATITKAFGAAIHMRHKQVDFAIVKYLSLGSIPAILFSSSVIHLLRKQHGESVNEFILFAIGIVLLITAVFLLSKNYLLRHTLVQAITNRYVRSLISYRPLIVTLIGAIIGTIVGITSIGSGSLIIVALSFLYPRLSTRVLVGTDIFQAFFLLLAGSIVSIFAETVNWSLVGLLLLGSLPGVFIGSKATKYVPDSLLRPILAIIIALTGIKLIF